MSDTSVKRPLRVFLCHATNDKPAVRELYSRLKADGFAPWLDEEDLLPGQKWQIEIPKAVRNSDVVLVCLSQHAINKTGYVQKEIKFALDVADEQPDGAIFLIPLRLETCDVPDRLSELQWVNFYDAGGYARLVRALKKRAADLQVAAPAPESQPTTPPVAPTASQTSGGVNVKADQATIGRDVVGRDQIHQTTINAQNVTIIQSGAAIPEIRPAVPTVVANRRAIGGLEFVRVPAGEFIMGSESTFNSDLRHTVDLPYDYWIGKYPVTNKNFTRFVEATKYVTTAEKDGGWSGAAYEKGYDWRHPRWPESGIQKEDDHPVVQVSWRDAQAYCQWLNDLARGDLQGLTVRLPTEAEWEKAARGGLSPIADGGDLERARHYWPWGNTFDNSKCNTYEGGKRNTTPVGAYSPQGDSPYGAADMAGNVLEWCHSLYKPYPYAANDGRENETGDDQRVLRGGAFNFDVGDALCAYRRGDSPDCRYRFIGFRVVVAPLLS